MVAHAWTRLATPAAAGIGLGWGTWLIVLATPFALYATIFWLCCRGTRPDGDAAPKGAGRGGSPGITKRSPPEASSEA